MTWGAEDEAAYQDARILRLRELEEGKRKRDRQILNGHSRGVSDLRMGIHFGLWPGFVRNIIDRMEREGGENARGGNSAPRSL